MERKKLGLELERLADRFSEGWHEGIKIDALDIVLLIEAAQALAQPTQESEEQRMLRRKWFGHRDTEHLSFVEAVEITMTTLMQQEQPAQNPLHDDAAAFRFLMKYNLGLVHGWESVPDATALATVWISFQGNNCIAEEVKGDDPMAAARRAIVSAVHYIENDLQEDLRD